MQIRRHAFARKAIALAMVALPPLLAQSVRGAAVEEVVIIGVAPGSAIGQNARKLPFAVKSSNFADLDQAQSLDLTDYLNSQGPSPTCSSAVLPPPRCWACHKASRCTRMACVSTNLSAMP